MTIRSKKTVMKSVADAPELTPETSEVTANENLQETVEGTLENVPEATSSTRTLTLYSSTTCSPCNALKPVLEKQMRGRALKYEVLTIDPANVDENIKKQFDKAGVTQVPTLIYKDGITEIGKLTGYSNTKQLLETLEIWGVFN